MNALDETCVLIISHVLIMSYMFRQTAPCDIHKRFGLCFSRPIDCLMCCFTCLVKIAYSFSSDRFLNILTHIFYSLPFSDDRNKHLRNLRWIPNRHYKIEN